MKKEENSNKKQTNKDVSESKKINPKNLIIIIAIFVVVLIIAIIFGFNKNKENKTPTDDGNNVIFNENENIVKDQELDGLKFTNTSLSYNEGMSVLITDVTNPTEEEYFLTEFKVIIKDEAGNVVTELPGYVGDSISPNETLTITSYSDINLTDAYSIEYEVIS